MKHTLKKVVSILLSVLMLVSLCTVAFAETTEAPKPQDFGLYSGTGIGEYVADPAGSGETVIKATNGNGTFNYCLANSDAAYEVISGNYYTITFDYLVKNGIDDKIDFIPYYGLADEIDAKEQVKDYVTSGVSDSFIGDGKWHSAAVSFLADPDDETLKNIYITYTDDNSFDGYFKNFEIIYEDGATGLYTDRFTTDMKAHLDCMTDATYGSISMTATPAEGTGNLILSGGTKKNPNVGYTGWLTHRAIFDSSKTLYKIYPGTTYTITLKYRVTNNPGSVYVGIGYAPNGTTTGETYVANVKKDTTTTDWQTLTAVFDPSSSLQSGKTRAFPRVILSSSTADGAIEIESVEIVGSGMPNAPVITFNDNGEIENHVAYAGSSITLKGDNGYLGEESDGWCTDTALTNVTDVIPSTSTSLYAKYDAVVIDNFNVEKLVKGYDYTYIASLSDGSVTVDGHGTSIAFMLPAYDAPATNGSGAYDYYQFASGSEYIVIIDYADITENTSGISRKMQLVGATKSGDSDDGIVNDATPEFITSGTESVSGTAVYHFTRAAGDNEWSECGMGICSDVSGDTYKATIEKIIITKVDDNTPFAAVYTPEAETDYTFVVVGNQVKLPEIEDTETEFFAGWYRAGNRISEEAGRHINIDDIALPGYYLADQGGFFELDANMISKESIKVDFSESKYTDTENPLEASDIGASFSIVTGDDIDTDGESTDKTYLRLNTTKGNTYKTSFFDDSGKRVLCYNDVTYNFEIRYKVITPDTSSKNGKNIGICRYAKGKYSPRDLDGDGYATRLVKVNKATDTFKTASQTVKVENLYVGSTETSGYYQSQLGIMVCSGDIYIDYVTITPVSYDPTYTIQDTKKGNISVDYLTGTVTVTPNEGYELASKNAINVSMTYGDVDKNTVTFVEDQNNLDLNTEDGINYTFDTTKYSDYAQKIGALRFDATFVESGTTANAAFIAVSGRQEKEVGDDGKYQSAGIRFRSRFSASTVDNASEIGFIIVPKKAITNASLTTVTEYLAAVAAGTVTKDHSVKGVAYNAEAEKHVIYKELNGFHDYQAVLTGLTDQEGKDLTSLYMMVAAYIEYADGTTTYIELGTAYKVDKATGAITQE